MAGKRKEWSKRWNAERTRDELNLEWWEDYEREEMQNAGGDSFGQSEDDGGKQPGTRKRNVAEEQRA